MPINLTYAHHNGPYSVSIATQNDDVVLLECDVIENTITSMSPDEAEALGYALVEAANELQARINAETVIVTDAHGVASLVRRRTRIS